MYEQFQKLLASVGIFSNCNIFLHTLVFVNEPQECVAKHELILHTLQNLITVPIMIHLLRDKHE